MKSILLKTVPVLLFALLIVFSACEKNMGPPTLTFIEADNFLSQDTMLMVGDTVTVGLLLEWNGKNRLSNLEVYASDAILENYVVEMEDRMEVSFKLMKSAADSEVWEFVLIDSKANRVSKKITLTKDPNSIYGPILSYDEIKLGAQANISVPGFLSLGGPASYSLGQAFENQERIDLVYYHDASDNHVISSPGANIPEDIFDGTNNISNWSTRNTTLFFKTELTVNDFASIFHDGFFIQNFQEEESKKKAKDLNSGDVYTFLDKEGRLGAFLVKEVDGSVDGTISISLKYQTEK